MNALIDDKVDLESLFGISFDTTTPMVDVATVDSTWTKIACHKCKGTGNFVGYSGRIVGPCFTCNGKGIKKEAATAPVAGNSVDVSKIAVAFATAFSNGKKRPKLRLGDFLFSRAPDTGRNAGSIYVKRGDLYLGKVTDGQFYPTRDCDSVTKAKVIEVAANPGEAAKAYGIRTGTCSCCARELTNAASIARSMGPTCADKYGF
jgi:hypothetical protein